jgi:hypothetical protein
MPWFVFLVAKSRCARLWVTVCWVWVKVCPWSKLNTHSGWQRSIPKRLRQGLRRNSLNGGRGQLQPGTRGPLHDQGPGPLPDASVGELELGAAFKQPLVAAEGLVEHAGKVFGTDALKQIGILLVLGKDSVEWSTISRFRIP